VTWFGLGPTLRVNQVLIGSDKLGHFMSQGFKYWRRHHRGASEPAVMRMGRRTEVGFFGKVTTGVFSNADLVANYEGYRFYRSLFEDGVTADGDTADGVAADGVAGKPAIIGWRAGRPFLRRPFDWADHVTEFWDEALNPNDYGVHLARRVRRSLVALCPSFEATPELFRPSRDAELLDRYALVGLNPNFDYRLDRICSESRVLAAGSSP
jgi:hypothetical protein